MAINFVCGIPGAGKTQWTIKHVKELAEKSGKDADGAELPKRPVYYANIKGLKLPWTEIDPHKWQDCPDGSIIVIDECQKFWPVRAPGSKVPLDVLAMSEHRHRGFDFYLVTQNGSRIDQDIRGLVGPYYYVDRPHGFAYSRVWTFQTFCDHSSPSLQAQADMQRFQFDKSVWALYDSATLHTHKSKIPRRVLWLFPALALVLGCGWYAVHLLKGAGESKLAANAAQKAAPAAAPVDQGVKKVKTTAEYLAERHPRIPDLLYSAPIYDDLAKPVSFPLVSACILGRKKFCQCYSQQGTLMRVSPEFCIYFVENGSFDFFKPDTVHGVQAVKSGQFLSPTRPALQNQLDQPAQFVTR